MTTPDTMTSALPGRCRCSFIPGKPCQAAITQEDLLCDNCRTARQQGYVHASFALCGPAVTTVSHVAIDMRSAWAARKVHEQ